MVSGLEVHLHVYIIVYTLCVWLCTRVSVCMHIIMCMHVWLCASIVVVCVYVCTRQCVIFFPTYDNISVFLPKECKCCSQINWF